MVSIPFERRVVFCKQKLRRSLEAKTGENTAVGFLTTSSKQNEKKTHAKINWMAALLVLDRLC